MLGDAFPIYRIAPIDERVGRGADRQIAVDGDESEQCHCERSEAISYSKIVSSPLAPRNDKYSRYHGYDSRVQTRTNPKQKSDEPPLRLFAAREKQYKEQYKIRQRIGFYIICLLPEAVGEMPGQWRQTPPSGVKRTLQPFRKPIAQFPLPKIGRGAGAAIPQFPKGFL